DATKFEVRIKVQEKEILRPGMSVSAEIETRYRTNVLSVPFASVTTRAPKGDASKTNNTSAATSGTNAVASDVRNDKKAKEASKPIEVVFLKEGDHAKMVPVKIGIFDDSYYEILEGLREDQEVISGGYRAI